MKQFQNKFDFRQNVMNDSLDIYIYSAIEADSFNWWTGEEVESETSARHFKDLLEQHPNVPLIRLFVNSEGGCVKEAMGIRSLLARHEAKKIAYIDGWAASAASFIVTVCDEVKMYSSSMQMLHNMWIVAAGNSKDLRAVADTLDKMMEGNRQAYLDKAGNRLTEEKLIELMEAESWMTAKDCIEYGLADEIISAKTDEINQLSQLVQSGRPNGESEMHYFRVPDHDYGASFYKNNPKTKQEPAGPDKIEPEQSHDDVGVTKGQKTLAFVKAIIEGE